MFDPMIWGTVSDWITLAAVVITAGLAFNTITNNQAAREEQQRPYVHVDFEAPIHPFFDFVIRNDGQTAARDVKFEFEPELKSTLYQEGTNPIANWSIVKDGIKTLPPGREYRFLFDRSYDRQKSDLPDTYNVKITYDRPAAIEPWTDDYVIDLSPFWGMTAIRPKTLHDIGNQLEAIEYAVSKAKSADLPTTCGVLWAHQPIPKCRYVRLREP